MDFTSPFIEVLQQAASRLNPHRKKAMHVYLSGEPNEETTQALKDFASHKHGDRVIISDSSFLNPRYYSDKHSTFVFYVDVDTQKVYRNGKEYKPTKPALSPIITATPMTPPSALAVSPVLARAKDQMLKDGLAPPTSPIRRGSATTPIHSSRGAVRPRAATGLDENMLGIPGSGF